MINEIVSGYLIAYAGAGLVVSVVAVLSAVVAFLINTRALNDQ